MNALTVMVTAMLLVTAISSSATSNDIIPYINIDYPQDGSTVGTKTTLKVSAKGWNLKNPMFSIEGNNVGVAGPLTTCVFSSTEEGSDDSMGMFCSQEIDLSSFRGEKVRVTASVNERSGSMSDSVGLYVSGNCA